MSTDSDDSFALSMSLAELAFLLIFVLLLLFALISVGADSNEEAQVDTAAENSNAEGENPEEGPSDLGGPDTPQSGTGTNPLPEPGVPLREGGAPTEPMPSESGDGSDLTESEDSQEAPPSDADKDPQDSALSQSSPPTTQEPGTPGIPRGTGLDHRACWRGPDGGIEYLFRLVIETDVINIQSIWPAYREDEARSFGAHSLVGENRTREEFMELAQPILDWSKNQDPECRHFFREHIDDIKNLRLETLAEGYMYKLRETDYR